MIVLPDCIACKLVYDILKKIIGKRFNLIRIVCNREIAKTKYNVEVFPTVIFTCGLKEIARISGSMPADYYKNVVEEFEKL